MGACMTVQFYATMNDSVSWLLVICCFLDISKALYLPDTLNRVKFRRLGVLVLFWQVHGDQIGTMTWLIVFLKIELMLEQLLCRWYHALMPYAGPLGIPLAVSFIEDVQTSDSTYENNVGLVAH